MNPQHFRHPAAAFCSHDEAMQMLNVAALAAAAVPGIANAGETATFLNAPATAVAPAPKLAVQFELKLRLPEGKGLARVLMDAGVRQDDAAAAARLAAGHLGSGDGGCFARVSIIRDSASGAYSLLRATVSTASDQTIIERRGSELAIASQGPNRAYPKIV